MLGVWYWVLEDSVVSSRGEPRRTARGGRIKTDLILLAVAVVWGSGFVAGRVVAAHWYTMV
jgi:hypothetical protein